MDTAYALYTHGRFDEKFIRDTKANVSWRCHEDPTLIVTIRSHTKPFRQSVSYKRPCVYIT